MNYAERIKAIATTLLNMGGTYVFFKDNNFCVAQEHIYYHNSNKKMMWLKEITPNNIIFGETNSNVTFEMSIDDFSEKFLCNVFYSYVAICHEQLTESAFSEIKDIAEMQ